MAEQAVDSLPDGFEIQQNDPDVLFNKAAQFTFHPEVEGGFVIDNGGPTNFGITQKTFDAYNKKHGYPAMRVEDATLDDMRFVAKDDFFMKPGFYKLPERVAITAFDYGINSGQHQATIDLQRTVGAKPDGQLGPKTLAKVNEYIDRHGEDSLLKDYTQRRQDLMRGLITDKPQIFKRNENGWKNRINNLKKYINISSALGITDAQADEQGDASELPPGFEIDTNQPGLDTSSANIDTKDAGLPEGFEVVEDKPIAKEQYKNKPLGELLGGSLDAEPFLAQTLNNVADKIRGMGLDRKLYDADLANQRKDIESMDPKLRKTVYGTENVEEAFAKQKENSDRSIVFGASSVDKLFFGLPALIAKKAGFDTGKIDELKKERPITSGIGEATGNLGSLLVTGNVLAGTKLPTVANKAGQVGAQYWNASTRYIPKVIMSAATFGTDTAFHEVVDQANKGKFDPIELGTKVAETTSLGGLFGALGGLNNVPVAVLSASGIGYSYAKYKGADDLDASLNGAVFGIMEFVGGIGRNKALIDDSVKYVHQSMTEWAVKKAGVNPADASALAARTLDQAAKEVGGWQTVFNSKNDTLAFFERVNNRIRVAIEKPVPAKPKAEAVKPSLEGPSASVTPTAEAVNSTPGPVSPSSAPSMPVFKSTEEALKFGKDNANKPEVLDELKKAREESLKKNSQFRKDMAEGKSLSDQEMQAGMDEAVKSQFYREALESAQGIAKPVSNAQGLPQTRENAFSVNPEAVKDITDLIEWESNMPDGGRSSFIDAEGKRQFIGNKSGHSQVVQDLGGPKVAIELLKKARAGYDLTDKEQENVNVLLEDYRKNIVSARESADIPQETPKAEVKTGTHILSTQEELSKFVDQVHEAGGEVTQVGPDPRNEDGFKVEITVPEQKSVETNVKPKEYWQMTSKELADETLRKYNADLQKNIFGDTRPKMVKGDKSYKQIIAEHKDIVEQAVEEGKPVPDNVLAEYPELQKAPEKEVKPIEDKQSAYEAGQQAFKAGKKAVPVHDPVIMDMIKTEGKGAYKLLEDWLKGWHQANLAEPVPEPKKEISQSKESGAIIKSEGQTNEEKADSANRGTVRAVEQSDKRAERGPLPAGSTVESTDVGSTGKPDSRIVASPSQEASQQVVTSNYKITPKDLIGEGTIKEKYAGNVEAIKLLKKLEAENRLATPEEQKVLVKYVGWGGLSQAFDRYNKSWTKEFVELSDLLTPQEYESARASTTNAHYTAPEVIDAMWKAVGQFGFSNGRVLEPSSGVGHFVGLAPQDGKKFSLVELDKLTGSIAKHLYQKADVQVVGFQEANLPVNFYDVVISNVPFADVKPFDAKAKQLGIPSGLVLHDYFFAKSLAHVKPGGVIAFITSKGTMDKVDNAFRKYLDKNAKFIGAIRLPSNAFKKNAMTEVVTDMIFLQKPLANEIVANDPDWTETVPFKQGGYEVMLNKYFYNHQGNVLGKLAIGSGLYSNKELTVTGDDNFVDQLNKAIAKLPQDIMKNTNTAGEDVSGVEAIEDHTDLKEYAFKVENGQVYQKRDGKLVPYTFEEPEIDTEGLSAVEIERAKKKLKTAKNDHERALKIIPDMVRVRDAVRDLLHAERNDLPDIEAKRKALNKEYDRFVSRNGYLNETKNEEAFLDDPDSTLISSLESVKKIKKGVYEYTKNSIFKERAIRPHKRPETAKDIKDAMFIALGEYGRPDWKYIGELLNTSPIKAQEDALKQGIVFKDPDGEKIVISDEYLSGNVKKKLKQAQSAAKLDKSYEPNVEALQKVIPEDLTFDKIVARIGMPWIGLDTYNEFLKEIKVSGFSVIHDPASGSWVLEEQRYRYGGYGSISEFGTSRMPAEEVFIRVANGKPLKVFDRSYDSETGKYVQIYNEEESLLAEQKADIMKEKFASWFWSDDARREFYTKHYNEEWNHTVVRKYDGTHLVFPAMNMKAFPQGLRKTQLAAIWRGITSNRLMLAHTVGAGKTATMIATAMEKKRLGLVSKSMVVAPKNTIPGWKNQINMLYPAAKVLIANEKTFSKSKRKKFLSRVALNDWDIIVIPERSFEFIPVSRKAYEDYINNELDELRSAKDTMKAAGARVSVKNIENSISKLEEKLKRFLSESTKDDGLTFEELGVDSLFVDEADRFKNLAYVTQKSGIKGMGTATGSGKSSDMKMKTDILRARNGNIVFATGTPISNSMVEAYTMMKFLQPEMLAEAGIGNFDDWSNAFGEVATATEVDVTGGKYKLVSRFKNFINTPELMKMIRTVWDIQTQDMLEKQGILVPGKNLPLIKGGKPTPVVLEGSPDLQAYIQTLVERADIIKKRKGKVQKGDDIMLSILSDGRNASLDMRLIDPSLKPFKESKIEVGLNNIMADYKASNDVKGTQVIFIDRVSPDTDKEFKPHHYMKKELIKRGIPENEIAFIHDYPTEEKKDDLYEKVNDGDIRILFGSTEKLGAGTNIQERLFALHHIDVGWRPRDIIQREGRIVRPGNINKEVRIYRYATKGSLDEFMYNLLEAKSKSIESLFAGDEDARSIDEDEINEFEQLKALSSTNPLVKEKADLDRDVRKLKALRNAHLTERNKARMILDNYPKHISDAKNKIEYIEEWKNIRPEKPSKDTFEITIKGAKYREKTPALTAIYQALSDIQLGAETKVELIGEYLGYDLLAEKKVVQDKVQNAIAITMPKTQMRLYGNVSADPVGTFASLDNSIFSEFTGDIRFLNDRIATLQKELDYANEIINKGFPKEKELEEKGARLSFVDKELQKEIKDKPVDRGDEGSNALRSGSGSGGSNATKGVKDNIAKAEKVTHTGPIESIKLSKEIIALVKKYAVRFGENYTGGNVGIFYRKSENIFVQAKNNLSVAVHEVTHYLDKKKNISSAVMKQVGISTNGKPMYDPSTKKMRKALTDIYVKYYPGAKKDHKLDTRVKEGLAVFFQQYVMYPAQTRKDFPYLVEQLIFPNGRFYDAGMQSFIADAKAIIGKYQALDSLEQVGTRVMDDESPATDSYLNMQEKAINYAIDNKYPLEKLAKEAGEHFTLKDPSLLARFYDYLPMVIKHNLSDTPFVGIGPMSIGKETYLSFNAQGELVHKYDYNWHTLVNKEKDVIRFGWWLVARRSYFNNKRLDELAIKAKEAETEMANFIQAAKDSGTDPNDYVDANGENPMDEWKATIAEYEEMKGLIERDGFDRETFDKAYLDNADRFKGSAAMYDKLVRADLELINSVGMIKPYTYDKLIKEEGYAPFQRDIFNEIVGNPEDAVKPSSRRIGSTKVSSMIRRRGSEKDIVNPVYSSMVNHQETLKKAMRQMVYNKVYDLLKDMPELAQPLKLDVRKVKIGKHTHIEYPQDKDPNVLMAYAEGKRIPMAVNKELKTLIENMLHPGSLPVLEQVFAKFSLMFVKGTTAVYIPFAVTNFMIDQMTAAGNSYTKFIPIYTPLRELVKVLSGNSSPESRYMQEYFMLGGERQALISFADMNPKEAYDFMRNEKNFLVRALDWINSGLDVLALPVKSSELMTRATEYIRARKAGYEQMAALELAGRVSIPFHHHGVSDNAVRFFVRTIPYFNSSMQVLAQTSRSVKNPRTRAQMALVMSLVTTAMVAGVVAILAQNKTRQKAVLESLRPADLSRYIYWPSPDGQTLLQYRVGQEYATIATLLNTAILTAMGNKYTPLEWLRGATSFVPDQLNPTDLNRMVTSWIPQAVAPWIGISYNAKSFPVVRPLVPDYMKYKPIEERVFPDTSGIAKWLGPKIGLSPIQFDFLIEGYTGRTARFVLGKEIRNPFVRDMYLFGSRQMFNYYEQKDKIDKERADIRDNPEKYSLEQRQDFAKRERQVLIAYEAIKQYKDELKKSIKRERKIELEGVILDAIDKL